MSKSSASSHEGAGGTTRDKAQLVELLLQRRSRNAQQIQVCTRSTAPGAVRLPASGVQQRLWFIDQLEGGSTAYHVPLVLELRGELDCDALQAALVALIERHEALRTTFVLIDGEPMQQIAAHASFELQRVDLTVAAFEQREGDVLRHVGEELAAAFDLSIGPLVRGRLLKTSSDKHVLIVVVHHIVCDGWSMDVLVRELAALYQAHREQRPEQLPALPIQYADYAQWQRQCLNDDRLQERLRYWTEALRGAPELLELPTDRSRPAVQSYRGATARVVIEPQLGAELRALSRRFNLTLSMTLFTAWSIVLSRLSGQQDLVIGMPMANRRRTELEGLIGFFVNTLGIRIDLAGDPSIASLLQRVKQTMLDAYTHQDIPFESVVEALRPARSLSHSPIFQAMFAMHSASRATLQVPGLTIERRDVSLQTTHFDLTLALEESAGAITGAVNYATDLFDAQTIERWIDCLQVVMRGMVRDSQLKVSTVPLLSEDERRQVIELFNATRAPFPQDELVHRLFEQQARCAGQRTAVVYEAQSLTYAELNARSNQLAHYLRSKGVGPDQRVALCVERGLPMAVSLLAILKAGGAYVPLDPVYPGERLAHMLADSAPVAVLTQVELAPRLKVPCDCALVLLDADAWEQCEWANAPSGDLDPREIGVTADNLAYVIYTSGSTGQPKGVMVSHRNVLHFVSGLEARIHGTEPNCRRVAWNSSFGFDMAVKAWSQLVVGRTVYLVPEHVRLSAEGLLDFLERHSIDAIECTPSHLRMMREGGLLEGRAPCLRKVLLGGEAIDQTTWAVLASAPDLAFFNMYGPTECSVDACCGRIGGDTPNVGRVMPNARVYILDAHKQPVPIGVAGEIHIGGTGVARGYLDQPELTAQRFLPDPFGDDPHGHMYKTGDLGRWRADGSIEYLRRNDDQVKIRGFRIELGEIEAQLARHAHVADAVVIAREDVVADKRLVAYVTRRGAEELTVDDLREHLKPVLPEYMMPSAFVLLERLPLTPNGKIDRRALPAPQLDAYASRAYEAPQGEVEEILAGIWQSLLRVERVGRQDNFFELGGHSLLIVQMMERLRRVGLAAEVRQIFESTSLAELASVLRGATAQQIEVPPNLIPAGCMGITPQMLPLVELEPQHIERIVERVPGGAANIQDIYPLAPLQEGILFHHLLNEHAGDTYVSPMVLTVSSRRRLEELIAALQCVIDRHDVLRTAVLWEGLPRPLQVVCRTAPLPVEEIALEANRDTAEQIREWLAPQRQDIDLRRAPLMRLRIAPDPRGEQWYCWLQRHHIICDHVTLEIVVSEVVSHLNGKVQRLSQPALYRDHLARVLTYAGAHDSEAFFRSKFSDVDETTAPFGLVDVYGDGTHVEEAYQEIELALSQRVRLQARRMSVSSATLFHAAWAIVIARISSREDAVFGSVLLGRLQGSATTRRTLGMFINTLPVRLRLQGVTVLELVGQTQRELIELLNHEQASLAVAQRCSSVPGTAPLFSALLNYRHSVPNPDAEWASAEGVRLLAAQERTNYPVTMSVDDQGVGFALKAQTDRRIDPRRLTTYLHAVLRALIEALEKSPQTAALALEMLPEQERRQVIESFNATRAEYSQGQAIHQVFEAQAVRTPDTVAVTCEGASLSYAELNARANRLARYLTRRGLRNCEYAAILMPRSMHTVVAQLAILKSGAAYVPVDPDLPRERQTFMIRDCAARFVLADDGRQVNPQLGAEHVIDLAALTAQIEAETAENLDLPVTPDATAYVMYTSGSTGLPKGVIVPHRGVNRLTINNGFTPIGPDDCVAHYSNTAFDASTLEVWGALLNGGRVAVVPQSVVLEAERFAELLKRDRVSVMYMSVGLFNQYTEALAEVFPRLRYLLVGGDALEPGAIRRVLQRGRPQHLLNAYGPTECTTISATYRIEELAQGAKSVPIGRPISNTQIYVLDAQHQPVPVGVVGEIYIGGPGVGCGYVNRPELTAQRFLPDPFSSDPQGLLYKTGDLGSWRADGNLDFLGRNDSQVKIRGFRIELGEIEAQLSKHVCVKEVVVLARQDIPGEKQLVAYVVPDDSSAAPSPPRIDELRENLKPVLPEYMMPSAFVLLERLPLTPNGKIDRRALPAPQLDAYASRAYEAPQGEVEEILAGIWQSLLRVERVGRQDNFFELGGHSLLIVQMMERLRRVGLAAEVRQIFESTSLAELASVLRGATAQQIEVPPNLIPAGCMGITPQMLPLVELEPQHIERIVERVPGGAANIQDIYPLAPLQEGILFHHLLNEHAGDTYVLPLVLSVSSRRRLEELIAALQCVIDRHDVLRTAVLWEGLPRPLQVVCRAAPLPVEEIALEANRDTAEQIREWLAPQRQRFDLRQAPMLRLQVAAASDGEWYALLQMHHFTIDHVTVEIVTSEVVAYLEHRALQVPQATSYRNHVAQTLRHAQIDDAETFFRERLADIDETTAPFDLLDVHSDGSHTVDAREALDAELAKRVRVQARRLSVSAATLFHAAWALVVARTTGRDDVVFGTVLLGRMQGSAGAQRILGMFINTLPIRLRLRGATTRELVERTQRELIELLSHEQVPLAVAQRCSGTAGSAPLFTSLFNYRHSVPNPDADWSRASGMRVIAAQDRTNYPITFSVDDLGEGFKLKAQTDSRLDPMRMSAYMRTALESLMEALEQTPHTPALKLSVLPQSEQRELTELFNDTLASYTEEGCVHRLFEEQARRIPNAVAAVYGEQSLTYEQLNDRANQLARRLRAQGLEAGQLAAICVERSLEMVVGLLGILKAGAAYVPLDPSYPAERLQYMLQDSMPSIVVTKESLLPLLPAVPAQVVLLDGVLLQPPADAHGDLADVELGMTPDLVYVIYTSGSTGNPKGTAMPHGAMVNLIEWHRRAFATRGRARVLQFAALSFDVAFQETFTTLCTGGTLVLLDEQTRRDPRSLIELLATQHITRLFLPPLMLQSLAECFQAGCAVGLSLTDVITAGEQLRISPQIVEFFQHIDSCRLHNHYGPTETHVVTALTLTGDGQRWPTMPSIGRPIANTQIYLLDAQRQVVPLGAVGEIYIAGANLARGYLRRPQLTDERFVPNPFTASARMYRTGDLGRWCVDGSLEYLGRNDDQVKVRGFRIELGEIESQLARHEQVREAAVIAREDTPGEKRLVAYVTSRDGARPDAEDLRTHLSGMLPEHMLPSAFIVLESLPLTSSGKLNRRALPAPARDAYVLEAYQGAEGEIEEGLVEIWRELLSVDRVGRHDNFFELGGHSLHGMKLAVRIEERFSVRLPVAAVFQYATIAKLAQFVDSQQLASAQSLDCDMETMEVEEGIIGETFLPAAQSVADSTKAARR